MNLHEQPAKPISFSPAMVEEINEGRKNQTRRLVKSELDTRGLRYCHPKTGWEDWHGRPVSCPFGKSDDLLWVREEHLLTTDGWFWRCEFKDGTVIIKETSEIPPETLARLKKRKTLGKWQRARFLPRYFARTYLKVTDIRVERLQDISEEDARAEGFACLSKYGARTWKFGIPDHDGLPGDGRGTGWAWAEWEVDPRSAFRTLWEKISGPGSWEQNPWVWVVEFTKSC